MAYRLPSFNLVCNISQAGNAAYPPSVKPTMPYRLSGVACSLVYGQRVNMIDGFTATSSAISALSMCLLLPALTDIRSAQNNAGRLDCVECPAGSGRWYWVQAVDDIAKGWPNEHRTALLFQMSQTWPIPYP